MKELKFEYVTYDELYVAYLDCRKRKRGTSNEISFEIDENVKLQNLYYALNNCTYVIGKSICFIVKNPVIREVFAADFIDRIVHHLFINRILHYIEKYAFIDDTYSCRVGKGVQYGVSKCDKYIKECSENYTKDCYILKCDLKSFFVSIDKDILYSMLKAFLKEKCNYEGRDLVFMEWLLKLIIFNDPIKNCIIKGNRFDWKFLPREKSLFFCLINRGIPIGNLTSQIFANFYLSGFDYYVTEKLGFIYYGRYVDDFFVIHQNKNKLTELVPVLRRKLKEINVTLHPKKIYLQHYIKGVKFIGHVIKPNRIYIGNRTKGNFYKFLQDNSQIFIKNMITSEEIEYFVSATNSYLGFMKHYATYNIRKKMLSHGEICKFYKYGYTNATHTKIVIRNKKNVYEGYMKHT